LNKDRFINQFNNEKGGIFIITLLVFSSIIIFGLSLTVLLSIQNKSVATNTHSIKAHYLAEAGIERAIVNYLLKDKNKNWRDDQFIEIYKNEPLGDGSYSVSLQEGSPNSMQIYAVGECWGTVQNITAQVLVDWQREPPHIEFIRWQENNINPISE